MLAHEREEPREQLQDLSRRPQGVQGVELTAREDVREVRSVAPHVDVEPQTGLRERRLRQRDHGEPRAVGTHSRREHHVQPPGRSGRPEDPVDRLGRGALLGAGPEEVLRELHVAGPSRRDGLRAGGSPDEVASRRGRKQVERPTRAREAHRVVDEGAEPVQRTGRRLVGVQPADEGRHRSQRHELTGIARVGAPSLGFLVDPRRQRFGVLGPGKDELVRRHPRVGVVEGHAGAYPRSPTGSAVPCDSRTTGREAPSSRLASSHHPRRRTRTSSTGASSPSTQTKCTSPSSAGRLNR